MKKKIAICLLSIFIIMAANAQKKIGFHSINLAGISKGVSGNYGILQSINGLCYKDWFAGIGAGIDYYKNRSVPLFIDISRNIPNSRLMVFGDLGFNYPLKDKPGNEVYYSSYHFYAGLYSEFGLGYKINFIKRRKLLITSGYSYKTLNDKIFLLKECLVAPCPVDYAKYKYGYGRLVIKAGIVF